MHHHISQDHRSKVNTADELEAHNLAELKRGLAAATVPGPQGGTEASLVLEPNTDFEAAMELARALFGNVPLEWDHTGEALLVRPVRNG